MTAFVFKHLIIQNAYASLFRNGKSDKFLVGTVHNGVKSYKTFTVVVIEPICVDKCNFVKVNHLLHFVTHLGAGGVGFLVIYAFFKNISWEYAEAAFIDGAGHFTVFFKIMLPMAVPVVGALALLNGIGAWNAYMDVLLYNPDWPTLASGLYGLSRTLPRLGNTPAYYAALVIALIPILVLFCIFSDKIMKNFSVGGLKG